MVCKWLLIGPSYIVAAVAVALIITPQGPAWLCQAKTACLVCV